MMLDCPDRTPAQYDSAWRVKMLRSHESALREGCWRVPKPAPHPIPPLAFAARLVMVECPPDLAEIARRAAVLFGVQPSQVMGNRRHVAMSAARAVTAFAARMLLLWSLPQVARAMGMKSHSSAIFAVRKVEREMERDERGTRIGRKCAA